MEKRFEFSGIPETEKKGDLTIERYEGATVHFAAPINGGTPVVVYPLVGSAFYGRLVRREVTAEGVAVTVDGEEQKNSVVHRRQVYLL